MASSSSTGTLRLNVLSQGEREKELRRLYASAEKGSLVLITVRRGKSEPELAALEQAAGLEENTFLPLAFINNYTLICRIVSGERDTERITWALKEQHFQVTVDDRRFNIRLREFEEPRAGSNRRGSTSVRSMGERKSQTAAPKRGTF
jgi:hypothetical protein